MADHFDHPNGLGNVFSNTPVQLMVKPQSPLRGLPQAGACRGEALRRRVLWARILDC